MLKIGKKSDLTLQRFGMLVAVRLADSAKNGGAQWHCACDCGSEKVVTANNLTRGKAKSCGCASQSFRREKSTKHGHTRFDGFTTPTYRSWHSARQRCENEKSRAFPDYGGRGIRFCERWHDFRNFLADMGEKPAGMSLDRIDVNGNYEPGNCRWADQSTQAANKRPRATLQGVDRLLRAAKAVLARSDESAFRDLAEAVDAMTEARHASA
jgi:hypothetical protein